MSVNVGITSKPGNASSTKVITPAIFPVLPAYNLVINQAETGAQMTSENSPIPGIKNDTKPSASNNKPSKSFWYFFINIFYLRIKQ